jgi:FkbM family methyltransferase
VAVERLDEAQQSVSEDRALTAERLRREAGIEKTRVLHVGDSRNPVFKPFDFETFVTDTSFGHAKETFQGRIYPPIPFVKTPARVLDIGANIGATAVTFALRYPQARIVAVEPARQAFALLRCNTARSPNVECYNVGLSDTTMTRSLFIGAADSLTNSIVANRFAGERREDIQLVAADVFAAETDMTRPDIIKIDTEGCELPILSAMIESVRAAKVVYLEYHSEDDRIAIDEMLRPTHILYAGSVAFPHRGEFVYVRNDAFPSEAERNRWRIGA